ncbi:MAG: cyclic nucleotide-binding domain-containing protein, partial [Phycisphaerae bacterium]
LRLDRTLLEKLVALETTSGDEISAPEPEEESDWMTLMLQSALFARVPAANIQRVFSSLQPVKYQAGDIVIRQGDPGDFYYVIQSGRCEVERQIRGGKVPIKLAELRPGDSFGEEALVADATRNATVRMLSPGVLMRLTKADFVELIKKPLLNVLTLKEAQERVATLGAVWLDVRFPDERRQGFFEGSVNIPLSALRLQAGKLSRGKPYIVYCDTGSRSAVGAFLLSERGYDVHYLAGGTNRYAQFRATPERRGRNVPELEIQAPERGGAAAMPTSS